MTKSQREYLLCVIDSEGFDYAFRQYSSFDKIKDSEFHRLRTNYEKAADALEKYVKQEKQT